MTIKDADGRAGHAGGHVLRLRDGWYEMVAIGCEKQCRHADVVQPLPDVVVCEYLQAIAVPVAAGRRCQLEKAANLRTVRVPRVQTRRRDPPDQRHRPHGMVRSAKRARCRRI
jgi:hypothetical protein